MSSVTGAIKNLSIRRKILLGFAALIALVGLGNVYGIVAVGQISREARFAGDVAFRKADCLTEIEVLVKRLTDSAATAADVGIPDPLSQAKAARDEIERKAAAALIDFREDGRLGRDFEELGARIEQHLRRAEELLKLATDRQWAAFGPARKTFEESQSEILQQVAGAKNRCVEELDGALRAIAQLTRRTVSSVAAATVIACLAALLIAFYISDAIVQPLKRLIQVMKEAQAGDVSVRAAVESRDETASLAAGFNDVLEELKRHQDHLEELVSDRTAQLEVANQKLETELELRQITEAARADSEELLRHVLDSVRAGILIVDAERHEILEANGFALKLIGARREAVVGRRCQDFVWPDEGSPADEKPIENSEAQLRGVDGRCIPILKSVVPVRHNGRVHLIESFVETVGA